jgi:NADH-quinone oxidoreductase subunit N
MGYLIIILLTGSDKGIQSAIFYLITYFITTIGAFGVISLLSSKDVEAENIEDYKGLFWKKPWTAAVFTLCMLSLAGIPITSGFIAKFYLIYEGMKAGLMILIFSMIINSVIGLYYYLRVITTMFSTAGKAELSSVSVLGKITLTIITLGILILGVYPGWLIDIIVKYAIL